MQLCDVLPTGDATRKLDACFSVNWLRGVVLLANDSSNRHSLQGNEALHAVASQGAMLEDF